MAGPPSGSPRQRPPWWPETEPWPPSGPDSMPWWVARRRFGPGGRPPAHIRRRLGCLFVLVSAVFVSVGLLAVWLLATVIGAVSLEGDLAHLARAAALVLLVVVVLAVVFGVRMGGRVVGPVADLIEGTRRIESGDYATRVTVPRGPGELRGLSTAFNTMAARLETEEATRRRLLADLGHELRTPIAVIEGHLEAILDGVYPADAAHLDPILDETRVLARLIDDLRTVSLAEAGSLPLHPEAVDLGHVITDVATALGPKAEASGARLATSVEPGLPELELDPVRIHQVLTNLVDNAIRYTPTGGTVSIAARRRDGAIEASVTDEGPGLAPDLRQSLFDRFVKSSDSSGSGLGLAIARAIVEAHGGTIRAEPGPGGRGTTIAFTLPIQERP